MKQNRSTGFPARWILLSLLALALVLPFKGYSATAPGDLAKSLVRTSGKNTGICSILGCDDGNLAVEMVHVGSFLVHVQDPRQSAVDTVRKIVDAEGIYGTQVVVEKGALKPLPYADNMIDLVLAINLRDGDLKEIYPKEILRVLCPEGTAVLGGPKDSLSAKVLKNWLKEAGIDNSSNIKDEDRILVMIHKPPLEGVDDWSHWEHSPDNNPASTDALIKAPYMTQWFGKPYYIAMPAITTAAGGRVFIAMGHIAHHQREELWLNTLLAENGYNGSLLWKRKLPDGYLAHRSAFIATDDKFYLIDPTGTGCLVLNAQTGEEVDRISIAEANGEWKWIALQDGILYALAGKQRDPAETTIVRSPYTSWSWGELSRGYYEKKVPWGFGETLVAYDTRRKKLLWTHKEEQPIDSRAMTMGGGHLFFYGPDSRIGCLDIKKGEVIWTNEDPKIRALIEEEGRGLSSTPGFKTTCICVYTPDALYYQGQTLMNVVAVSTKDGSLMWHRKKTSSNPNILYADGKLLVGIGPEGSTLMVDPLTGETIKDLGFAKRSCARLTATPDSFFVRGMPEGLTRYDRNLKKIFYNGAFRPSCNDGVIGANGLLYLGPWACDCNLSLMGRVALCSAGDFQFNVKATESDRLEVGSGDLSRVADFEMDDNDWSVYRGNNHHSASTKVPVAEQTSKIWEFVPERQFSPSAATAAGGLLFLGGDDGKVRALDAATGTIVWTFLTGGPVTQPPTLWNGRAYIGSGDGYICALEAATGRLLWRFRAAPVERRIMVYGSLCSTWPVNSGILVEDGVVYGAAGIIDYDGTYLYALDAVTGEIIWQNHSSGHLDKELRKGVSAQGVLTSAGGRLWMPGGNIISPAIYDLKTGEYLGKGPGNGAPDMNANRGEEIGIFRDKFIILGGRLRYSASENVVDPGRFDGHAIGSGKDLGPASLVAKGKIPPAWNDQRMAFADGLYTKMACCSADTLERYLSQGNGKIPPEPLWRAVTPQEADTIAIVVAPNVVLSIYDSLLPRQLVTVSTVAAFSPDDGTVVWQNQLASPAMPGGLLVDRDGRVIAVHENGAVTCIAGDDVLKAYLDSVARIAQKGDQGREKAIALLNESLKQVNTLDGRDLLIARIEELGGKPGEVAEADGCITRWKIIGPVPWDYGRNNVDKVFVDEPDVDITKTYTIDGQTLKWRNYFTVHPDGMLDLARVYGMDENLAAYAYAEVELPNDQKYLLKIGSNDGCKVWFNGEEVFRFDAGRAWGPDQNTIDVMGKKGVNKILMKITQMGSAWALSARITYPNGKPVDLTHAQSRF